ncbi:PREDICTED: retinol dehydrogenase 11-like [Papilio xuthus]|uniref:Retinol dehydrogenase 11-like n=1 Tax=Papilio xuthus TaxID=66420 RepID=A0AAJ6ZLX9_PAPXU|nr:PREDICTED: retinol dehydrogenase 11-like [Papilio xuthus]
MITIQALIVIFKLIAYLFISFVFLIITLKMWLEPKSGVCRCKTKLHGKTALVTGGNSGIGLETARDLAGRGARVIIACRNEEKSKQAIADIIETTGNNNVEYRHLNLCKFSSIREFADNFNKTVDRLDFLVNNAGCAGLPLKISDDGLDLVLQTNHFGPFLLTNLLMDKLIASMPSRIIIVSSFLHNFGRLDINDLGDVNTKGYYFTKYANSKLCNLLWMKALVKRLPSGVTVNSLHPGFVWTNIFKRLHTLAEKLVYILTTLMFKDSKEGAQTSIHLCVCPELSEVSGEYFKDCKMHSYHKLCKDDVFVDKFWEKCISLTAKK